MFINYMYDLHVLTLCWVLSSLVGYGVFSLWRVKILCQKRNVPLIFNTQSAWNRQKTDIPAINCFSDKYRQTHLLVRTGTQGPDSTCIKIRYWLVLLLTFVWQSSILISQVFFLHVYMKCMKNKCMPPSSMACPRLLLLPISVLLFYCNMSVSL